MEQYKHFSEEDFVNDPRFQEWIFRPDKENQDWWQHVVAAYPDIAIKIEGARKILLSISFKEEFPSSEKVEQALADVLLKINEPVQHAKVVGIRPIYKWLSAAASLLLIISVTYLLINRKNENSDTAGQVTKIVKDQIVPGGDKAVLTLADGTVVVLDSAGNKTVANQGDVTVINIDGKLSYMEGTADGNNELLYNTISTPKGGQYQLLLADGSKIWLNAASSLRFPTAFNGHTREVELTGEGYFEVAHNPKQPFHVKVNDMEVAVLGTHFNINSYSDEPLIKTTLTEGKVQVTKGTNHVFLNPGQQAVVTKANRSDQIQIQYNIDVEEILAWKNGIFSYNNRDIKEIMRQVARWYDVEVAYEADLNETFTGGLPRSKSITDLLKIIEATTKVKFEINGKKVTVK
ncbi:FecR family protein [Lacibacter sediminis]|uniref:FecR domain-containing protein n=1 Tax=Lacibacter sediminis TaxID=2760713 RepID=A0A7G5XKH6_9BACT|nr:FecR family protein [Lacibacter sediminis]QNA45979.1 FecR domain-containing protein [Lacibacter sediminis]